LINLVNGLPNIESIYLDSNPCWPINSDQNLDLRIKFLGAIHQLDRLNATLKYLNGYPIKIAERCKGLVLSRVYNDEGIEKFRIDLAWEQFGHKSDNESLNLSGLDIRSTKYLCSKLVHFNNLRELDLSNNSITTPQDLYQVLDVCLKLNTLDIRDNSIKTDLRGLIDMIRTYCPMLTKLNIERSLSGKETQKPIEYASFVFSQMLNLKSVDSMDHPSVEQGGRKIKSVFGLFDSTLPPLPSLDSSSSREANPKRKSKTAPSFQDLISASETPFFVEQTPTPSAPMQTMIISDITEVTSIYPDLNGFSAESYLPSDYHQTIGKKYDRSTLSKQMALLREQGVLKDEPENPNQ